MHICNRGLYERDKWRTHSSVNNKILACFVFIQYMCNTFKILGREYVALDIDPRYLMPICYSKSTTGLATCKC